jgi:hypothetical protein
MKKENKPTEKMSKEDAKKIIDKGADVSNFGDPSKWQKNVRKSRIKITESQLKRVMEKRKLEEQRHDYTTDYLSKFADKNTPSNEAIPTATDFMSTKDNSESPELLMHSIREKLESAIQSQDWSMVEEVMSIVTEFCDSHCKEGEEKSPLDMGEPKIDETLATPHNEINLNNSINEGLAKLKSDFNRFL